MEPVRSDVRRRHPEAPGFSHAGLPPLEMAPRRDVREAERRDGLPLAGRRQEGEILESYVMKKRDKSAALAFMKKALKRHGRAETIVTDGLRSYPAAMRDLGNLERREMGQWLNNCCENSHLGFRRRERAMLIFRRMKTLQKYASIHADVANHFNLERHLIDRPTFKERRSTALAKWQSLAV